jgi:hypothetical protein
MLIRFFFSPSDFLSRDSLIVAIRALRLIDIILLPVEMLPHIFDVSELSAFQEATAQPAIIVTTLSFLQSFRIRFRHIGQRWLMLIRRAIAELDITPLFSLYIRLRHAVVFAGVCWSDHAAPPLRHATLDFAAAASATPRPCQPTSLITPPAPPPPRYATPRYIACREQILLLIDD